MAQVRRRERGAAAIEFAIVVPLLLLLIFGIIEYGFLFEFRQSISQAASEGARAAAIQLGPGTAQGKGEAAVTEALGSRDLTCGNNELINGHGDAVGTCTVSVDHASCSAPDAVDNPAMQCAKVEIEYHYAEHPVGPDLSWLPLPSSLTYAAVAVAGVSASAE